MKKLFLLILFSWLLQSGSAHAQQDTSRERLPRMTLLNHTRVMKQLFGKPAIKIKTIGILVYDGASTIEAVGAMSVFSELMNVKIEYIAAKKGDVRTDRLKLIATKAWRDVEGLDLLYIPGGTPDGLRQVLHDSLLMDWVRKTDRNSKLTAASGYGTLVLGHAGVLKHKRQAAPWYEAGYNTQRYGGVYDTARYLRDGKYWTSVGGTGVLDMALAMVGAIAGERYLQGAMLDLEYDPAPPARGGTPAMTDSATLHYVLRFKDTVAGYRILGSAAGWPLSDAVRPVRKVGILVYKGFFTLDAIGPLAVLSLLPGVEVQLIAKGPGVIRTGRTRFHATQGIENAGQLDLLLIPGGSSETWGVTQDSALVNWVRTQDEKTIFTTSVCTGSWVLGSAGLLNGRRATSHWYRAEEMLTRYGARFVRERYTSDGKYWTSAGVSAGIDLSYALLEQLYGPEFLQYALLELAYDPQPPVKGGRPEHTHPLVTDMMEQMYDFLMVPLIHPKTKEP